MALAVGTLCNAQVADSYKASKNVVLRAPTVPLITSDPYLSIWSPADALNESSTMHWTGTKHPLLGAMCMDRKTYRFMGKDELDLETLVPMTDIDIWQGGYTFDQPAAGWNTLSFNATGWKEGQGAFGTPDMPRVQTRWTTSDIWVRREFQINDDLDGETIYLKYSHDDVFELYLNGEKLVATDCSWNNNVLLEPSDAAKKKLQKGKNVLAAHRHNTTGGAYVDFGLYRLNKQTTDFETAAVQKSVNVLPTQTYYTFTCGPVELGLVFTAPLMIGNPDLLSTPVSYISYRVRSLDKKQYDVQMYVETAPQLAISELTQPTRSKVIRCNGINYVQAGTIDQPIPGRKGDGICIDWRYAYLAGDIGANTAVSLGNYYGMKNEFATKDTLLPTQVEYVTRRVDQVPAMAYTDSLGKVGVDGKSGFLMLGYDDICAIEYLYQPHMAYRKHDDKVTTFNAFERAKANYASVMERCRACNQMILNDTEKVGGKGYSELCTLAYRQVIVAHKPFKDANGNLLFFSKENNSNGYINTVDLTYPSAPPFLAYNPELQKGMMTSIFEYSTSGRQNKPFPAHDIGTYPIANEQAYGGDMLIEEGGNMVVLIAAIAKVEGNADYARKYQDLLTIWTDYSVEYGQDPENQLCTDDFTGRWAHNANLSVKAIMGVAGYGEMACMLGIDDVADRYVAEAKAMATKWEQMAREDDHYRLAFDRENTWSQKYNMIWGKIWNLHPFPNSAMEKEVAYYLTKQNLYGLLLDSRKEYTKPDWIMWSVAMSSDKATFEKFISPIYKYANETVSRAPLSD